MIPVIQQHLTRAQHRMKAQADKNRTEREFVAARSSQKLGFKFFGPYLVLQRIGNVAYKLQPPPTARIHPVVHVSQLKKAVKPTDEVSSSLPIAFMRMQVKVQPAEIIEGRLVRRGNKMMPQVLIRWEGLPANCISWEPLHAMVNKFPGALAWGQAGSAGRGNVTLPLLTNAIKAKQRTDERQRIREAHLAARPTA